MLVGKVLAQLNQLNFHSKGCWVFKIILNCLLNKKRPEPQPVISFIFYLVSCCRFKFPYNSAECLSFL